MKTRFQNYLFYFADFHKWEDLYNEAWPNWRITLGKYGETWKTMEKQANPPF